VRHGTKRETAWNKRLGEKGVLDVNWTYYRTLLDHKIADAQYNYDQAEKKAREAKAVLDSVLRERDSFDEAVEDLIERKG
jgi:hypothetical protein